MTLDRILLTLAIASGTVSPALAQGDTPPPADHSAHHASPAAGAQAGDLASEGEVRKVNREAGKVTLRHGPLANLDMPAMTMVFTAADPRLLDGLKEGDKVRFTADRKDGTLLLVAIQVTH
jgi:Cu/Ag efflux protein CusF